MECGDANRNDACLNCARRECPSVLAVPVLLERLSGSMASEGWRDASLKRHFAMP